MPSTKRGFTLIELLVVIGIVVILSVVVVLTLNPAQLLAQARDSTRISDLATMKSAISLYLADVSSPDLDGSMNIGCGSSGGESGACNAGDARFSGVGGYYTTSSNPLAVDGTGWIPVNFGAISSGAPISALPVDPTNNTGTVNIYYAYKATTTQTYELNANLESTRYTTGDTNYEASDGGNAPLLYETGTYQGLSL